MLRTLCGRDVRAPRGMKPPCLSRLATSDGQYYLWKINSFAHISTAMLSSGFSNKPTAKCLPALARDAIQPRVFRF
jgi:hypothetical protein